MLFTPVFLGFPVSHTVKNPSVCGRPGFDTWVRKIPWRRHGKPLQYSFLEKPHGQKSLARYSSWGCEELDMTEQLST